MPQVFVKRGTRSEIDAAAAANGLNAGEPYLITDENRIAIGLSASTYETYAKESEAGGGSAPSILYKSTAETLITNTTSETDLFSYTVPGGMLGTDGILRLTIRGGVVNTTGTSTDRDITASVKFGATTLWLDTRENFGNNSQGAAAHFDFNLSPANSTDAQRLAGFANIGTTGATTTGVGDYNSDEIWSDTIIRGVSSEDSTTNKDLKVTIQLSHASSSFYFFSYFSCLELL